MWYNKYIKEQRSNTKTDEITNKLTDELLKQCSLLQLEKAVTKISKEIENRKDEIQFQALTKFQQAFEDFVSVYPEFTLFALCEDCGCNFEIDGEEALRTFFEENGV